MDSTSNHLRMGIDNIDAKRYAVRSGNKNDRFPFLSLAKMVGRIKGTVACRRRRTKRYHYRLLQVYTCWLEHPAEEL